MPDHYKLLRNITILTLSFLILWGIVITVFPLRPFWRDEWCIIYNFKFKTGSMLWGPLDFTQQFPRVFLQLVKLFTSRLHYSYFSLRFPSLLISTLSVLLGYNLMGKLFTARQPVRLLFVLIIAANPIFIDYFVQIKQYEMEILLALLSLWQCVELLDLREKTSSFNLRYVLLCAGLFAAPFFSYTYPIAIAPVFIVMFIYDIVHFKSNTTTGTKRHLLYLWLPLLLCSAGIALFYCIDVSQLMKDRNMYGWWEDSLFTRNTSFIHATKNLWLLFAKVGAGFIFEIIFGILGILSFIAAAYAVLKRSTLRSRDTCIRLYCALLLVILLSLYFVGRIPFGYPRFTVFIIPAVAILIVFFLSSLQQRSSFKKIISWTTIILFIALTGNIFSAGINLFIAADPIKQRAIYTATEDAIHLARKNKTPIFITPAVGYPDDITVVLNFVTMPGADGLLKTFPAYDINDTIAIYPLGDLNQISNAKKTIAPNASSVLAGDGLSYKMY